MNSEPRTMLSEREVLKEWSKAVDDPRSAQAAQVAEDFVGRAIHNYRCLIDNLRRLGYAFAKENPLELVSNPSLSDVAWFESTTGVALPVLLKTWFLHIRAVDLSERPEASSRRVRGMGSRGAMTMHSLPQALDMRERLLSEALEDSPEGSIYWGAPDETDFFVPTGGYVSNGDPKVVFLPNDRFDPFLYNDGGGWMTFADELRESFAFGGFPTLRAMVADPPFRFSGLSLDFASILPVLKRGLVPL